jgi:hypothetical protein
MLAGDADQGVARSAASIKFVGMNIDHQCDQITLARLPSQTSSTNQPAGGRSRITKLLMTVSAIFPARAGYYACAWRPPLHTPSGAISSQA